jgi:glycosyltransferase involved in cell wall biosynthesis
VKVLVAHNRYRSALPSGENAVVDDDIEALRAAGVDVVTLMEESDDIPNLGPAAKLGVASGPVYNPAGVRRMRIMLGLHRPDVVHIHNVFPLLSPWVVRAAHDADLPVVQTVHNFRRDCVAGTFFRDGKICTDCAGHRLAMPALRHGCYRGSRLQTLPMVVGRAMHESTWRSIDRFLVLTTFHAEHLAALGVPEGRIVVRPTSAPDPGEITPPGNDVLFVGRLDAEKGVELLLDAWERRPRDSRRLVVAGDGPLAELVRTRAHRDPSITFAGRLALDEVAAAMESAAVVALPSVWLEGFPRVAVEAMARGRALLVVGHGGLASVVDAGCGWLLPPDVPAWAEALGRLDDSELRSRGAGARSRFEARFERSITTGQLLRTYGEVTAA